METLIVVPARMGSTRFPGKPLAELNGISMLRRTADVAARAAALIDKCAYVVATDHEDIKAHCDQHNIPSVMTDPSLPSGTDRAFSACKIFSPSAKWVVNLQGDAPFTDISHVTKCVEALKKGPDVTTPYIRLSWDDLDILREHKKTTPFSGTTLIHNPSGRALWFSKNIIPAIKHEAKRRSSDALSPVCRHIGLYTFTMDALERYINLPKSHYQEIEDLEQLKMIEADFWVQAVEVDPAKISTSGIDSPEDLQRAEIVLNDLGDPFEGRI